MIDYSEHVSRINTLLITDKEKLTIADIIGYSYGYQGITQDMVNTRVRRMIETNVAIATAIRRNQDHWSRYMSLHSIGKIFNKNHATIIHYIKLHDNVLIHDEEYMEFYSKLENKLKSKKEKVMYITVLDFEQGQVFQYTTSYDSKLDDSEVIENFLIDEGHRLTSCEWMSHSDGEIITNKVEI